MKHFNYVEAGNAVDVFGRWLYIATINASVEANLVVRVVATDRPGGTAVQIETLQA